MNKKEAKKLANELLKKHFPKKGWKIVIDSDPEIFESGYCRILFKYNDVTISYDEIDKGYTAFDSTKNDVLIRSKNPIVVLKKHFENQKLIMAKQMEYNKQIRKAIDSLHDSSIINNGRKI